MIYVTTIVGVFMLVLYSCIATTTTYDQMISDKEQENFLKLYTK